MSNSEANLRETATTSLLELARGDRDARDRLFSLLYDDLRARAAALLRGERTGHTLQATALVGEAYARLIRQDRIEVESKRHFVALAAQAMRRVLLDHARAKARDKRGGARPVERLDSDVVQDVIEDPEFVIAVNDALAELRGRSARLAQVVELRFFGGCTVEEVAETLGVDRATVGRDWRAARALLSRMLSGAPEESSAEDRP